VAEASKPEPPVSWQVRLLYGLGEMPITMIMVLFGLFALFFYNSVLGLPAQWVGIGISAGLVLDALVDPYIGHISDGFRHRFGRRHPFMFVGSLAMGPAFWLLFSPPQGMGPVWHFVWLVIISLVFRFVSAIYRIPYLSLGAELSSDYNERTQIIGIRSLFGLLGTIVAAALSFLLFFPSSGGAAARLEYSAYPKMGLSFGLAMTAIGLACTWGTVHAAPAHVHAERLSFSIRSLLLGFRDALGRGNYRWLWFSFLLFFLGMVLNVTLAVHYFSWYVELDSSAEMSGLQAAFYVGALLGVPVWMLAARKLEKRTLYLIGSAGTALVVAMAVILFGDGRVFGTGHVMPLMVGHALAGAVASCMWILPASMIADVVDEDELANGVRREGLFFGLLNLGEKIGASGAILTAGLLLNYVVKLDSKSAEQAPGVVAKLGLAYSAVPAALLVLAAILILRYDLSKKKVREMQNLLAIREESK
jgi:Na+/melibiose symporter-like transporter